MFKDRAPSPVPAARDFCPSAAVIIHFGSVSHARACRTLLRVQVTSLPLCFGLGLQVRNVYICQRLSHTVHPLKESCVETALQGLQDNLSNICRGVHCLEGFIKTFSRKERKKKKRKNLRPDCAALLQLRRASAAPHSQPA